MEHIEAAFAQRNLGCDGIRVADLLKKEEIDFSGVKFGRVLLTA
jgi:hypothetical protein